MGTRQGGGKKEDMHQDTHHMVPVFVADRVNHLQILAGLPLSDYPAATIGIMANAQTSGPFRQCYHAYPCLDASYCEAIGAPCPCWAEQESCSVRQYILAHTLKMCDSGAFKQGGVQLDYGQLFHRYVEMGVAYGIMMDVLGDQEATLASAEHALRAYTPFLGQFVLVGVAQGRTIEEYLSCYRELKQLGFTHVAVGGLLQKISGSARYTQVRDECFMFAVLEALRCAYPTDWLMALGTFHPRRLVRLRQLSVWADSKGWLFQYESRQQTLSVLLDRLLEHLQQAVR
jgi:hypothetical protein